MPGQHTAYNTIPDFPQTQLPSQPAILHQFWHWLNCPNTSVLLPYKSWSVVGMSLLTWAVTNKQDDNQTKLIERDSLVQRSHSSNLFCRLEKGKLTSWRKEIKSTLLFVSVIHSLAFFFKISSMQYQFLAVACLMFLYFIFLFSSSRLQRCIFNS